MAELRSQSAEGVAVGCQAVKIGLPGPPRESWASYVSWTSTSVPSRVRRGQVFQRVAELFVATASAAPSSWTQPMLWTGAASRFMARRSG